MLKITNRKRLGRAARYSADNAMRFSAVMTLCVSTANRSQAALAPKRPQATLSGLQPLLCLLDQLIVVKLIQKLPRRFQARQIVPDQLLRPGTELRNRPDTRLQPRSESGSSLCSQPCPNPAAAA